jgi:hypothetical protein
LRSGFFGTAIKPVSYRLLAGKFAGAPRRIGLFSCRLLGRLLSHKSDAASFRGTRLPAAFSSSEREKS